MIGRIGLEADPIILQLHLMNARPNGREHADVEKYLGVPLIRHQDIHRLGCGLGDIPKKGRLLEHGQTDMIRG